jgi:hypothetical protein
VSEATREADLIGEWLSILVSPVRNDAAGKDWFCYFRRTGSPVWSYKNERRHCLTCRSQGHRLISEAGAFTPKHLESFER